MRTRWGIAIGCLVTLACGQKGPPLVPFVHVPQAVGRIEARRLGADVYVTLDIPAQNVDASSPADVSRVDVFAVSADAPPPLSRFLQVASRIASVPVIPAASPGTAAPPPAATAGVSQGAAITIRETLTADALIPKPLPPNVEGADARARDDTGAKPAAAPPPAEAVPGAPDVDRVGAATKDQGAALPIGPSRYYLAVAFSRRQRASPLGAVASVSLAAPPEAPARVTVTNTADSIVVSWDDSSSATAYNVYRDEPAEGAPPAADDPLWSATVPAPLTRAPVPERTFSETLEFGRRRCYRVRAVRSADAGTLEGEPSEPPACHTPEDTFPPGAPTELSVSASSGGITLKWASNTEKDLAGYLILRGRPGDATLLPITGAPVTQTQFLDRDVMPGARYVYAVVAVDRAMPTPNRSLESERDEATAQ